MSIYDEISQYHNFQSNNSGVEIHWQRTNNPVVFYQVQRSNLLNGNYQTIATVTFPTNQYTDTKGREENFYRILEIDTNNQIIRTGAPMVGNIMILRDLYLALKDFMNISINDEEAVRYSADRKIAYFAFKNWASEPKPEIRLPISLEDANGNEISTILDENSPVYKTTNDVNNNYPDGLMYSSDYNGAVYFTDKDGNPTSLKSYDSVFASYTTKLFTNEQINAAAEWALQTLNGQAGTRKYQNIAGTPPFYDPAIVTGATYFLVKTVLLSMSNRERRLLLQDDTNGAFSSTDQLKDMKSTLKEEWDAFLKSIPTAYYPNTKGVVMAEYYLPGGRSRFVRYVWKQEG